MNNYLPGQAGPAGPGPIRIRKTMTIPSTLTDENTVPIPRLRQENCRRGA